MERPRPPSGARRAPSSPPPARVGLLLPALRRRLRRLELLEVRREALELGARGQDLRLQGLHARLGRHLALIVWTRLESRMLM